MFLSHFILLLNLFPFYYITCRDVQYLNTEAVVNYINVGGSGSYGKVTYMDPGVFGESCPANSCVQEDWLASGSLAPFNEEMTMVFRGPMLIREIGVYSKQESSKWGLESRYSSSGFSDNLVFMNNKGGECDLCGEWTPCGGNSQSYATYDGYGAASQPQQFTGHLPDGVEVNIMSGVFCGEECGFTRPIAMHGWSGSEKGDKIFITKVQMLMDGSVNIPAIWMLHADIVRTAQYGCNCRGMGTEGPWKGGCGELDVAEVLWTDLNKVTSTIYSFKGAIGAGQFADRPVNKNVIYVTIFDSENQGGTVKILALGEDQVDFDTSFLDEALVQSWLDKDGVTVDFGK